jgi:hypothetical protein
MSSAALANDWELFKTVIKLSRAIKTFPSFDRNAFISAYLRWLSRGDWKLLMGV